MSRSSGCWSNSSCSMGSKEPCDSSKGRLLKGGRGPGGAFQPQPIETSSSAQRRRASCSSLREWLRSHGSCQRNASASPTISTRSPTHGPVSATDGELPPNPRPRLSPPVDWSQEEDGDSQPAEAKGSFSAPCPRAPPNGAAAAGTKKRRQKKKVASPEVRKGPRLVAVRGDTGEYTLGRQLGCGQFGVVKLVTHAETGDKFALKIVDKKKFSLFHTTRHAEGVRRGCVLCHQPCRNRRILLLRS